MFLTAFLASHGSSITEVVDTLLASIPGEADDVLFLSGSLVEGVGNSRSDVDLYHAPRSGARVTPATFGDVAILPFGSFSVDLETLDATRLTGLVERLTAFSSQEDRDSRRSAVAFSPSELKVLHNLWIGQPIRGAGQFETWRRDLDDRALCRVLFDYAAVHLDLLHSDILGMIETGQEAGARQLLRVYRMHLAGALLASLGETNPSEKWRLTKLEAAREQRGHLPLPGRHTLRTFVDEILALDGLITDQSSTAVLGRLLHLSYALLPWAQDRFFQGFDLRVDPSFEPIAVDRPARDPSRAPPLPALSLECQLGRDRRGTWLSAIRSPDFIYVNGLAHDLLLSFDGRTTTQEARRRIARASQAPAAEIDASIHDFQNVLAHHALI